MWETRDAEIIEVRKAEWLLKVLGIPFSDNKNKDIHSEYFSEKTEIGMEVGDARPVFYFHGDNPDGIPEAAPEVIGRATLAKKDKRGWWFDVILNRSSKYAKRIINAAADGLARASTGTAGYLKRWAMDGEITLWPVAELTLVDKGEGRIAANDLAIVSLKAIYEEEGIELPQAFVGPGEGEATAKQQTEIDNQLVKNILEMRKL